jgi:S-adenosylmethionine synthetase
MRDFAFTSVSVTDGHPDKLCDRISDAIVDAYLRLDPWVRIEAECAVSTGVLFCACHSSSTHEPDIPAIARGVIERTGYDREEMNPDDIPVMASVAKLPEIERDDDARVAHQNITTFGYATDQTETMLPLPIDLAHRLTRELRSGRAGNERLDSAFKPDGQAQVTIRYVDRQAVAIEALTLLVEVEGSDSAASQADARDTLFSQVIEPALDASPLPLRRETRLLLNPPGVLLPGGPARHSGVTGRKLGVDLYGDFCRQPTSALSGKDTGRIDRMATYAARHAAKNIVVAGLARECEVQLSYTIGSQTPVSVEVDTFQSGRIPDSEIGKRLRDRLGFTPAEIDRRFGMRSTSVIAESGFFEHLAAFGQVGRLDMALPWERTEVASDLAG